MDSGGRTLASVPGVPHAEALSKPEGARDRRPGARPFLSRRSARSSSRPTLFKSVLVPAPAHRPPTPLHAA